MPPRLVSLWQKSSPLRHNCDRIVITCAHRCLGLAMGISNKLGVRRGLSRILPGHRTTRLFCFKSFR